MSQPLLPRQQAALVDSAARATPPFYAFLRSLESNLLAAGVTPDEFAALVARVVALEESGGDISAIFQGLDSISVVGSLESGLIRFFLKGDEASPGATFFYGTGTDGAKGWFAVGDALDTATLAKVVDSVTGVVSLDLADLTDTGIGAALVKITRDGYGRVEGMEDAALDDLSDVDTTTVPPADGDTLAWDAGAAKWAPRAVAPGGAGEILVADGLSAPPVMLTNEAEDDFLYSDT